MDAHHYALQDPLQLARYYRALSYPGRGPYPRPGQAGPGYQTSRNEAAGSRMHVYKDRGAAGTRYYVPRPELCPRPIVDQSR